MSECDRSIIPMVAIGLLLGAERTVMRANACDAMLSTGRRGKIEVRGVEFVLFDYFFTSLVRCSMRRRVCLRRQSVVSTRAWKSVPLDVSSRWGRCCAYVESNCAQRRLVVSTSRAKSVCESRRYRMCHPAVDGE